MPGGSIEPERSPPSATSDIGGEEKDGFRDLLRLRDAFHWYARDEVSLVFGSAREPVQHAGLDRSRSDDIDAHPGLGKLKSCCLGKTFHRMLAGNIESRAGCTCSVVSTGNVDDAPAALREHHS